MAARMVTAALSRRYRRRRGNAEGKEEGETDKGEKKESGKNA